VIVVKIEPALPYRNHARLIQKTQESSSVCGPPGRGLVGVHTDGTPDVAFLRTQLQQAFGVVHRHRGNEKPGHSHFTSRIEGALTVVFIQVLKVAVRVNRTAD
jgi:hypothetical protein